VVAAPLAAGLVVNLFIAAIWFVLWRAALIFLGLGLLALTGCDADARDVVAWLGCGAVAVFVLAVVLNEKRPTSGRFD
jgi:hypothetical protein